MLLHDTTRDPRPSARPSSRRGAMQRAGQPAKLCSNSRPVYVRQEIVHNKHVVEGLKAKGDGCDRLMHPN